MTANSYINSLNLKNKKRRGPTRIKRTTPPEDGENHKQISSQITLFHSKLKKMNRKRL